MRRRRRKQPRLPDPRRGMPKKSVLRSLRLRSVLRSRCPLLGAGCSRKENISKYQWQLKSLIFLVQDGKNYLLRFDLLCLVAPRFWQPAISAFCRGTFHIRVGTCENKKWLCVGIAVWMWTLTPSSREVMAWCCQDFSCLQAVQNCSQVPWAEKDSLSNLKTITMQVYVGIIYLWCWLFSRGPHPHHIQKPVTSTKWQQHLPGDEGVGDDNAGDHECDELADDLLAEYFSGVIWWCYFQLVWLPRGGVISPTPPHSWGSISESHCQICPENLPSSKKPLLGPLHRMFGYLQEPCPSSPSPAFCEKRISPIVQFIKFHKSVKAQRNVGGLPIRDVRPLWWFASEDGLLLE